MQCVQRAGRLCKNAIFFRACQILLPFFVPGWVSVLPGLLYVGPGGKVKPGAGCIAQGPTPFRQGPTLFFQQLFRLLLQAVRLVYRPASADAQQLDVENQGGVARYGAAGARAVAQVGRHVNLPAVALVHATQGNLPAGNQFAHPEGRRTGLARGIVEHTPVDEAALVVYRDNAAHVGAPRARAAPDYLVKHAARQLMYVGLLCHFGHKGLVFCFVISFHEVVWFWGYDVEHMTFGILSYTFLSKQRPNRTDAFIRKGRWPACGRQNIFLVKELKWNNGYPEK